MKKYAYFLIIFGTIIFCTSGYAQSDKYIYNSAQEAMAQGDRDFAFMHFRSLLRFSPNSRYYKKALFATGEYYFTNGDYYDAEKIFSQLIESYPENEALPFAIMYLLKIDQLYNQEQASNLKKQVIQFKQLSLLFSEFKEYSYTSPLNYKYKAIYFIDRVEFYINGELFEEIYF
ncbi:MAG: outer membrane protein assembly factor BamD [Candidatus Omnitrophota bacterium]